VSHCRDLVSAPWYARKEGKPVQEVATLAPITTGFDSPGAHTQSPETGWWRHDARMVLKAVEGLSVGKLQVLEHTPANRGLSSRKNTAWSGGDR
jgi:hypothetical protein